MVNHTRKFFSLFKPTAEWFNDAVRGSGLSGLCMTGYSTISHGMQGAFVERWHKETSSIHLPVGEMTITTSGPHIRFTILSLYFEHHLVAADEAEDAGDELFTHYHRGYALRCWYMHVVGAAIFVDKSASYVDVTYLRYFMD